jgi:hypothetical protein
MNDVKQMEMHTAEPLVNEPSSFKIEIPTEKLRRYKSPGTDEILAELIQAGGNIFCSRIHKLIKSIWNEEVPKQWKESIIVPIYKKREKTKCSNYRGIPLLPTTYKILSHILLSPAWIST